MEIYTIGFTKKSANTFFELIKKYGIKQLIDIRLNNKSQLAGFAKKDDLEYFLKVICNAEYVHEPLLAPTQEILDAYKRKKEDWKNYEMSFIRLIEDRKIEEIINKQIFETPTVLLCSEESAQFCHRRLVAEYLRDKLGDITICHL
jgi:uncharacterized protein (DUF488 family)